MGTDSYFETFQTVDIADHGPDYALCYVMDPDHFQYTRISLEEQAASCRRLAIQAREMRSFCIGSRGAWRKTR